MGVAMGLRLPVTSGGVLGLVPCWKYIGRMGVWVRRKHTAHGKEHLHEYLGGVPGAMGQGKGQVLDMYYF